MMTVRQCEKWLLEVDPNLTKNHECFPYALVLLYGTMNNYRDPFTLMANTGVKQDIVMEVIDGAIDGGIWNENDLTINVEWFDEGLSGIIAFWCDVCVVMGAVVRFMVGESTALVPKDFWNQNLISANH